MGEKVKISANEKNEINSNNTSEWDIGSYFNALENTKNTRENSDFTAQQSINAQREVTEAKVALWEQTIKQARDYLDRQKKQLKEQLKRNKGNSDNIIRKINAIDADDEVLFFGTIRGNSKLHGEDMSKSEEEELKEAVITINRIREEQKKTRDETVR